MYVEFCYWIKHLGLRRIHADGSRHLHWVVYLLLYSPCGSRSYGEAF
jgi:hypothetical protein